MSLKTNSLIQPNIIISSILCAGLVVGFLFGSGLINTSSAKQNIGYVSRQEFEVLRREEREDKQILFKKIDKLNEQLSEIAQGLARLEGSKEVARIQGAHER